jgi:hypothetical protein
LSDQEQLPIEPIPPGVDDAPLPEPGTVARERPFFVRTPEDARRWDACELLAMAMGDDDPEWSPTVMSQTARSLYFSDTPTDPAS